MPTEETKCIILFRGDDTDFRNSENISIEIDTELSLEGCKAYFEFLGYVQEFESIPDNKKLHLVFPKERTVKFPLCISFGKLWIENADGKRMTISNRINVCVTNSTELAYSSDVQNIKVSMPSQKPEMENTDENTEVQT